MDTTFHEIKKYHYSQLHLDKKENPRLPSRLIGKSDEEIIEYMLLEANLLDLIASIGAKGFFPGEPLLVTIIKGKKEFTVVEGNRRLSAVILLNNPALSTVKKKALEETITQATVKPIPEHLPVVIYKSRQEIIDYLGYRHITGVKPWDSLAKARYLEQLFTLANEKDLDKRCKELAKVIGAGTRTDYVRKLLCGLSIYKTIEQHDYFDIKKLNEESISFSLITTAIGYSGIMKFIRLESNQDISPDNLHIDNLKLLTKWMFDKSDGPAKLRDSRDLDKLSAVVSSEFALKELKSGEDLEFAYYFSEGAKDSVINGITEAQKYLDFAFRYAKEVTLEKEDMRKLDKIMQTANAIIKLTSPE